MRVGRAELGGGMGRAGVGPAAASTNRSQSPCWATQPDKGALKPARAK